MITGFRQWLGCLVIAVIVTPLHGQNVKANAAKLQLVDNALHFIVMGDWGRNGADHQKEVAAQMAKTAEEADVEFIITTGDNFYPSGVGSEFDPLWKYSFEDIYKDFSLQHNWYPVLGNHDYGSHPEAQVAYSKISRRWNMPARYYSEIFNLDGDTTRQLLIAFIDTTPLIKDYYRGKQHHVHDQDSTAQKKWLEKTLSTSSPNIKWKLVVGHHPMYTGGSRTENYATVSIRRQLQQLLSAGKVDAFIAGHEHSLQHIGPVMGVHHFISGAASEHTPVKMLPQSKFAASEYGFMLFSATVDQLLIQVIDYKGNVLYATSLKK